MLQELNFTILWKSHLSCKKSKIVPCPVCYFFLYFLKDSNTQRSNHGLSDSTRGAADCEPASSANPRAAASGMG